METQKIDLKDLGGVGTGRKVIGFILLLVFAAMGLMSGFEFYDPTPAIMWAIGIVGLSLMIAGIAKDVVAIAKNVIK